MVQNAAPDIQLAEGSAVRIYHNPRCSKSREALKLVRDAGFEPEVVLYLDDAPDRAALTALLELLEKAPSQIVRKGEKVYKELGLASGSEDAILKAMLAHPILIERPIVVTTRGARLGRPPEVVREILP